VSKTKEKLDTSLPAQIAFTQLQIEDFEVMVKNFERHKFHYDADHTKNNLELKKEIKDSLLRLQLIDSAAAGTD
jgi:hypothetical protein